MADYWKSLDKKYCDICKCWLTDNKSSVDFHENGKRHKENVQKRLKDIQKKNKFDEKKDRKLEHDLKRIEQAALAACKKDMEDNPDVSMKLESYYNKVREESGEDATETNKQSSSGIQPKILHRSDKDKKKDEAILENAKKPVKPYTHFGGWEAVEPKKNLDFELPINRPLFTPKVTEKRKITFTEKTVAPFPSNSSSSFIKAEPVLFKKRKFARDNMRQRDGD